MSNFPSITEIRINKNTKNKSLANCSICIDNIFIIRGIQLLKNKDDVYYLSWPSNRSNKSDKFIGLAFPTNQEFEKYVLEKIIFQYKRTM